MFLSPAQIRKNRYEFELFCKKVIRGERCDYFRKLMNRAEHEMSFSDLPTGTAERLRATDEIPGECYNFDVYGYKVPIRSDLLAEVLLSFTAEEYSILLLSYALEFSDKSISELLGKSRSGIQRQRSELYEILKEKMRG